MELYQFWVIGVLFSATLIASTFGFGVGLIAIPFLALFIDIRIATPLAALATITVIILVLWQQWRDINFQSIWRLVAASCLGAPLGLLFLRSAHDGLAKLILAVVIIIFSIYSLMAPRMIRFNTDRGAWIFGALAGFLGGAYAIPGPPVLIYGVFRDWPPGSLRATLSGFFLPSIMIAIISHWAGGLWTRPVWALYGMSLLPMLAGILIGTRLNRTIPKEKFGKALYVLLFLSGLILLINAL